MTKTEMIQVAENIFTCFTKTCNAVDDITFFDRTGEKWSVAENVQHLIISTNTSSLAWYLPKFLVRWIGGTPNRNSRTYDELKNKYYTKLSEGGRATGRFVPKRIEIKYGKQKILNNWNKATAKFIN